MTYIDLINNFWEKNKKLVHPLSSCEITFYLYLLHECNLLEWENPFRLPTRKICFELDFRKDTITNVRNSLKQKGFINFVKGDRRASDPEYSILGEDGELVQIAYQNPYQKVYQNSYQNTYQSVYQNEFFDTPPTPPLIESKEISSDEDIKKDGRTIEERKRSFYDEVSPYIPKYGQSMIDAFCEYWTRLKHDNLMRFESEETFSLGGRLATWHRNNMSRETKVTDISEKEKLYGIDWDKVKSWYTGLGLVLSRWTDGRKRAYISIIESYGGDMGKFREAVIRFGQEVRMSDWIMGLKGSPMRDFEWLFTEKNFTLVIDGKYRNNDNLRYGTREENRGGCNAPDPSKADSYYDEDDESWRHR